jgi:putative membrane protein
MLTSKNVVSTISAALFLLVLGQGSSFAQKSNQPDNSAPAPTTNSQPGNAESMAVDQRFAKDAASGGMAEVKLGQLAQEKGSNDAVKNFGQRMVTDHSKADDDLKAAASNANIDLPNQMSAKDQATYDRLSKLSGSAFDRAYARAMVTDHRQDIAQFRKEATNGENASIKNFASQTLPTLQEHLKLAQQMEKAVSSQSSANNNSN